MTILLLSMLVTAAEPGLVWGFTLQGGGQVATDKDVDDVGGGWCGELRFDVGEMVTDSLGVGIAVGFGTGTTALFNTAGGYLGLTARWYVVERLSLQPTVAVAFLGLSRRDDSAIADDDPASLFGTRAGVGVAYDLVHFDGGFVIAIGVGAQATYGSGLTVLGGGATVSLVSFR